MRRDGSPGGWAKHEYAFALHGRGRNGTDAARPTRADLAGIDVRLACRLAVEGAIDLVVGRRNPYDRKSNALASALWETGVLDGREFLEAALSHMLERPQRHLPVMSIDELVGLLREAS
jgi:hypothetical protein